MFIKLEACKYAIHKSDSITKNIYLDIQYEHTPVKVLGFIHQTLTLALQGGISLQGFLWLSGKLPFVNFQFWHIIFYSPGKMTINTKLDEKLEGADNFRAWKYRVMLILEENNLEEFIEENIPEPEEDEDKTKRSFSFNLSPPTVTTHLVHEAYELRVSP